jgi:hypothetical protein
MGEVMPVEVDDVSHSLTLRDRSSHVRSNNRCTPRAKLSTAITSRIAPITPTSVFVAVEGASVSLTASAPPPVRA